MKVICIVKFENFTVTFDAEKLLLNDQLVLKVLKEIKSRLN